MLSLAFKSSANDMSHLARTENVQALLLVDLATDVFLPHIRKEMAVENVMFWREVLYLERMEEDQDFKTIRKMADKIFKTYIAENAPSQVNVSNHVKESIATKLAAGDDDGLHLAFSEAILEIEQILAQGAFLRFLNGIMDDLHVSWSRVQERTSMEGFCEKFYEKLYKISPEMKRVFRNTKFRKDEMLLQVIQIAVPLIAQLDAALPELLRLGRRHKSYNAQGRNFDAMKLALFEAINDVAQLRSSERKAWEIAFEIMSGTMQLKMNDEHNIVTWKVSKGKKEDVQSKKKAKRFKNTLKVSANDSKEDLDEKSSPSSAESPKSHSSDCSSDQAFAKNLRNAEILFELDSRFSIFSDGLLKSKASRVFDQNQLLFWKDVFALKNLEKSAEIPTSEQLIRARVIYDDYLASDAANAIFATSDDGKDAANMVRSTLQTMMKGYLTSPRAEIQVCSIFSDCVKILEKEVADGVVSQYLKHNAEILATSWIKVREKSSTKEFSEMFYKIAFKLDSELIPLFAKASFTHEEMVLSVVDLIVPLLTDLEAAISTLVRLGERHRRYGATPARMEVMGKALVMSLKKVLGAEWKEETELAWTQSFKILSSILLKTMHDDEIAQLEHDMQTKGAAKCLIS
jgi:hemoglobin-like flavoprotein